MSDLEYLVMDVWGFQYVHPMIIRASFPLLLGLLPCAVIALSRKLGTWSGNEFIKGLLRFAGILLAPFLIIGNIVIWKYAGFDPSNVIDKILAVVGSFVVVPIGFYIGFFILALSPDNAKDKVRGSSVYRAFKRKVAKSQPALVICCHDGIRIFWGNLTWKPVAAENKVPFLSGDNPENFISYKKFVIPAEKIEDIDFAEYDYPPMTSELARALIELFYKKHKMYYKMGSNTTLGILANSIDGDKFTYSTRNGEPVASRNVDFHHFAYSKLVYNEVFTNSNSSVTQPANAANKTFKNSW